MPRACDRDQVLAALSRWHRQHGCVPTRRDWDESAGGSRPWSRTIQRRWGWHALWGEAPGVDQVQSSRTNTWPRLAMIEALLEAHAENGAWPSGKSWERMTAEHPVRRTYVRRLAPGQPRCERLNRSGCTPILLLTPHPAAHECKPDQPSRIRVRCGGAARAGRDSDRAAFSTPCPVEAGGCSARRPSCRGCSALDGRDLSEQAVRIAVRNEVDQEFAFTDVVSYSSSNWASFASSSSLSRVLCSLGVPAPEPANSRWISRSMRLLGTS